MEKLIDLYNRVVEMPTGCKLTNGQKSIVVSFVREFNKYSNQNYSPAICRRQAVISHAKKFLTAHGKL